MRTQKTLSRRGFLRVSAVVGAGAALTAACQPEIVEKAVVKEVEKEVTRVVAVQPTEEPIVLRLMMRAGGYNSEPAIYNYRPAEFTEETGIGVKLEPIPGGEYNAKIETLAASGTLGDNMFSSQSGWYHSRMVHFGVIAPVDEMMDAQGISRDEWLPATIGACTFGGKTMGLPKCAHPGYAYVFLNNDLLDEAGIPIPERDGNTYDDIAEWATKLTKGPVGKRDTYGYYIAKGNFQAVVNALHSFGAYEVNEDGVSVNAEDPFWKQMVRFNHRALVTENVSPQDTDLGSAGVMGLFAAGKLAMFQGARSQVRQARQAVGPEDGSGEGKFPWSTIGAARTENFREWGLSLNTHSGTMQSQHKLESFKLTYALSDARFSYLVSKHQGYLVGRTNEMEEIKEMAEDPFLQLQFYEQGQGTPYRVGKNLRGTEYDRAIRNAVDAVYLGARDADDAFFAELNMTLNDILQKPVP